MTDCNTFTPEQINHFWSRVDKSAGPDECWPWTGYRDPRGYGDVRFGGRVTNAHRVAYELANGPIPPGDAYHTLCVCHRCDCPECCNPAHLFLGSHAENTADMMAKGRHVAPVRGDGHPLAKLTEADIPAIRAAVAGGEPQWSVALRHGVSGPSISNIIRRKTWKHVPRGDS